MPEEHAEHDEGQQPTAAFTASIGDMKIQRSPDFISLYVNNAKFATNAFEFGVYFGEISEDTAGELFVEQKAKILMSPLHAKIFAVMFLQNVKNFEAKFGEIKIPAGAVQTEPPMDVDAVE